MPEELFQNLFSDLYFPVVVSERSVQYPVVYMNIRARMLFFPTFTVERLTDSANYGILRSLFKNQSDELFESTIQALNTLGHLDNYRCNATSFEGKPLPVSLSSTTVKLDQGDFAVIYFNLLDEISGSDLDRSIVSLINTTFAASDVDESINRILAQTGERMNVDRVYIFEEISPTTTRNTYEWCAGGVESAIQDLQSLKKTDYNYEAIVNSGMFITDDIRNLTVEDGREVLETQGIRSLAILTFYDNNRPLGYVGYDNTKRTRTWQLNEIRYLKSVSNILALLIKRRKSDEASRQSFNIMQTISDSLDDVLYVNSVDDYIIQFVSKATADSLGKSPDELIGRVCWQELQRGQTGVCDFCPIPKILFNPETGESVTYEWEHKNSMTERTYYIKDNLVRWVDGRLAHIETAIDISKRIEQEERLLLLASTDTMTGVYNRQWATRLLDDMLAGGSDAPRSLCFCDLDGLKNTNDRFGHTAGDIFLRRIVDTVKSRLYDSEFICRWGGDEFMILFLAETEDARERVKLIQQDLREINERGENPFPLSFSYGIVPFTDQNSDTLDTLVTKADSAMYRDKMEKRNVAMHRRRTDPAI